MDLEILRVRIIESEIPALEFGTQGSWLGRIYPVKNWRTRGWRKTKTISREDPAGERYSRIGKLRRLRGQPQGGWKMEGPGRCQDQIQLLTPENTETVITTTRKTAKPTFLSFLLP